MTRTPNEADCYCGAGQVHWTVSARCSAGLGVDIEANPQTSSRPGNAASATPVCQSRIHTSIFGDPLLTRSPT